MARTNLPKEEATIRTHQGALAAKESPEKELLRTVSACLLWEDTHYERGVDVAKRIADLSRKVSLKFLSDLAVRAREELKLRHAPLYLALQMLSHKTDEQKERNIISETIARVIHRADELAEIVSLWWKDGKKPLPRQLKGGIAKAFRKFDAYQLSKWNRDNAVKLRDVLFLSHAKPKDEEQAALWKKLVDGTLESAETWEVRCSRGEAKKDVFTDLLQKGKLGYMALLANLRNMAEAGVDKTLVEEALVKGAPKSWALPFRFITAARHAPQFEEALGKAVVAAASALPKMSGHTLLVIDVSGSMWTRFSSKSELSRVDAANGLAILMREQCEEITIYATAGYDHLYQHRTEIVPSRHGFALADAVKERERRLGGGGIFLKQCMDYIDQEEKGKQFDRVVVITDEQDCDRASPERSASKAKKLGRRNYIVNVGVYEPALPVTGAGWIRVSGFSERLVDWMMADEKLEVEGASVGQQNQ